MSTSRRTLGDLDASCLNSRFDESGKSPSRQNENPFATKCKVARTPEPSAIKKRRSLFSEVKVARTPEASAVKKRKSLFLEGVQSSRPNFKALSESDQGGVTNDNILRESDVGVSTPASRNKREHNEKSSTFGKKIRFDNVKEIVRDTVNIFKDFAISSEELGINNCEDLLISNRNIDSQGTSLSNSNVQNICEVIESDSSIVMGEVESLTDADVASKTAGKNLSPLKSVPSSTSPSECDYDSNSIESDLDQLNIGEILQAFRDDAKAAERAIELATICGRLHPKEFREYLRAFRSPPPKEIEKGIDGSPTSQGSLDGLQNDLYGDDVSKTQLALLVPSTDLHNILPVCHCLGQQSFPSPKSSLLHFLEMADTPIGLGVGSSQNCLSDVNVDFASSEKEVKEVVSVAECTANKRSKTDIVEVKHISIKDRADEVRIVVAAAVASVSNIPKAQTTPLNSFPTQPTLQPISPPVVSSHLLESQLLESIVDKRCSDDNFSQMKEEEGFHPRKVMMRTPPKIFEESVVASTFSSFLRLSNVPETKSNAIDHEFVESTVTTVNESVAHMTICSSRGLPEINEEISSRICEVSSHISVSNQAISTYHDEWSVLELDRVDRVIRRVSLSVPDCPSVHTVMGQLKVEISRLKKEASTRNDELLAITADRQALLKRLDDVEMATHKSCTLIAKYEEVAEKNSAAYRQSKIDAEIEAAKEVVDRLAAQKDIIIQKRSLRDIRLKEMDDEVAAEMMSGRNRQLRRKESLSHQLPFIHQSGGKNVLTVNIPPSSNTITSSQNVPQNSTFSPSHSSSVFKLSSQPLIPSKECSFFKPLPIRPTADASPNFLPQDLKTFSGLKNGITAFDKITNFKINSICSTDNQKINANNDNQKDDLITQSIKRNEIEQKDMESKELVTLTEVVEKLIENQYSDDLNCQKNSADLFNESDNVFEQNNDYNNDDVVDCNMSDLDSNDNDNNAATDSPRAAETHEHYNNRKFKERTKSDQNKTSCEDKEIRRVAVTVKKPATVNYYGNLKFVSLKVKSSKPRPLHEEEYSSMTSSEKCSDINNDDCDRKEKNQDTNIEKKEIKQKKIKGINDVKKIEISENEKGANSDTDNIEEEVEAEREDTVIPKSRKQRNDKKIEKDTTEKKTVKDASSEKVIKTKKEKATVKNVEEPVKMMSCKDNIEDAVVEVEVASAEERHEETKNSPQNDKIDMIKKIEKKSRSTIDVIVAENNQSNKENKGGNLQSAKVATKIVASNKNKILIHPEDVAQKKLVDKVIEKKNERAILISELPVSSQNVRTATPYALFCATRKLEMKNKNILSSTSDLLKIISAEWKVLSLEQKEQWITVGSNISRGSTVQSKDEACANNIREIPKIAKSNNSKKVVAVTLTPVIEVVTDDPPSLPTSEKSNKELPVENTQPTKMQSKKSSKDSMEKIVEETITISPEMFDDEVDLNAVFNETELKHKKKRKDQKRKEETNISDGLLTSKRGRKVHEKLEKQIPNSFDMKVEDSLFSSSLSLSPVLAMPSSPVFLAAILPDKKAKIRKNDMKIEEKVSRKRNMLSLNDDIQLPSNTDDHEILTEEDVFLEPKKSNNLMLPPKIPSKKMKADAKTDTPQIDQVPFEEIFQAPKGLDGKIPKGGDKFRIGTKPDNENPFGIGSSSSSSMLNMSTSTVSSMFSTTSTVRSKSQFVIPKLKKKC